MAQEKNFENKIKAYLKEQNCWVLKYWAGAEFTKEGIPDILACVHGIFFGIEVKAPKGRPTILQLKNLRSIRRAGGIGVLVYPKDWYGFRDLVDSAEPNTWYVENIKFQEWWFDKLNT